MKKVIYSCFLVSCLFSMDIQEVKTEKKSKEEISKEEFKKSEELKDKFKNYMNNKDDQSNVLKDIYIGKDGTFYGKKVPKVVKVPEIKTVFVKPEERQMSVNKYEVKKTKEEMAKTSLNMANLYEFLSLYGMEPRKDGNLPNEKELYKLIESKKIKLEKTVVKAEEKYK